MTEAEPRREQEKLLKYYLDGGNGLYRAYCPELDITCYVETTEEDALASLLRSAISEIRGINEGKGDLPGKPDERRPLAQRLAGVRNLASVFERVPGTAPERGGLK